MAEAERQPWANNIVEYGVKKASEFKPNPANWRTHPDRQRQALEGALDQVGWLVPVIENRRTGHMLDGHLRVDGALRNGDQDVPYIVVDVAEADEPFVLATLDPIAAMAQVDKVIMADTLRQVETDNAALQEMISAMAEESGLYLDYTSTDRKGQGVTSTWDMLKTSDNQRVIIGRIEAVVPVETIQGIVSYVEGEYERDGTRVADSVTAILKAGLDVVVRDC